MKKQKGLEQRLSNCVIGINGRDARLNVSIGGRTKTLSVFIKGDYVPRIGQPVIVVPVSGVNNIASTYGLGGYEIFAVQGGESIPFAHTNDI